MKLYLTLRFWLIMGRMSLLARRFTTWERLHSPLMIVSFGFPEYPVIVKGGGKEWKI